MTPTTHANGARATKGRARDASSSGPRVQSVDQASLLASLLPRLWAFALRISGDTSDAEALVRRACTRSVEQSQRRRENVSPICWMFSIVWAIWSDDLRARGDPKLSYAPWSRAMLEMSDGPGAEEADQSPLHARIIRAVERLPQAQRAVLILVQVEGFDYAEAGEVLDIPIESVIACLSRARLTIASTLDHVAAG
jgi:RNA polymerase sigma-70 factor (ECF subfamily)